MFSFRPDSESTSRQFVPTPLDAARAAEILGTSEGLAAPPNGEPVEGDAEEVVVAPVEFPTPEERAALERAAFDRGVESVRAEQQALAATCESMDQAIAAWRTATSSLVTANRRQVLDLSRELVAHWVRNELVSDPDQYAGYLERALDVVQEDDGIRLFVSEADLARLETHVPEALERWRSAGASVTMDPQLAEASFRIDTAAAAIEGDLGTLADRLREVLDPALSAPPPQEAPESSAGEEIAE